MMMCIIQLTMISYCMLMLVVMILPTIGHVTAFSQSHNSVEIFSTSPDKFSHRRQHPVPFILSMTAKKDSTEKDGDDDNDDMLSLEAFQKAKDKVEADQKERQKAQVDDDFDGYAMRDVIYAKWGACYDVDFNRVDSFGFRSLYLNVLPFQLGGRPFRHKTELDYLCHLQAVVEILQKYNQLEYILYQIQETKKKPRPNTSPIVAVPLRLDLTPEQVTQILNM